MTTIRMISPSRRTTIALLVAAVAAILVAFAASHEPASTTVDRSVPSEGSARSSGNDDAVGQPVDAPASAQADGPLFVERSPEIAKGEPAMEVGTGGDSIAPAGAPTLALPELDAKIVRSGQLELDVRRRDFEDAWGNTQATAGAFGGYVLTASRSGADDGPRTGTITMRIPSARFDAAVDRLRDTPNATVERLEVTSQDVTQEFVDVRSRLRHDRAVEGRLLALLARTATVSEVLAVQARLDTVQEQIEVSQGRLDYLEKLTAMSTLSATISAPSARPDRSDDDDPSVLGDAVSDARERFSENVGSAIVWLGGALPALLLLAVAGLVARLVFARYRRRNAVLEPAGGVSDQT